MACLEGLIRGFNQRACEFWGQTPKLFDHDNRYCGAYKLFYPDGEALLHHETPMAAAIQQGLSFKNTEVVILRPDGTSVTVSVNITPLRDEEGHIIGAINAFQDISEVVDSRRKIEAHRLELERRDAFLSICSHELKTPLTVLLTQSQMAQRKIARLDDSVFDRDRIKWMIDQNGRQYEKLNRLVDDMLDLHRIKSGKLTMQFEKLELVSLIHEVAANNILNLDNSEDRVIIHSHEAVEGVFDRQRIEQVLTNLIGNAVKYGTNTPIEVDVEKNGETVKIHIRNEGMGIAEADHTRIFERFERAVSSRNISGLGLGLFVTKQIVEAHQGQIRVQSELGKGSTFTVELPLSLALPPVFESVVSLCG